MKKARSAGLVPERLFRIAMETRWWAEAYAKSKDMGQHLAGMCAIASFELWKRLRAAGIRACVIHCWGHILVRAHLRKSWLIDVTATQFRIELPKAWFPTSLRAAQKLAGDRESYQQLQFAYSFKGVVKLFDEWATNEIHPDIAALRSVDSVVVQRRNLSQL